MASATRVSDGERILKESYSAWAMGDIGEALVNFSPDAVYVVHVPIDVLPYGGETRGIALLVPRLKVILELFNILKFAPVFMSKQDDRHNVVVNYHYRHRATGQDIDGTMRHVVQIQHGQIVRFDEYHDTERIRAFFKLLEGC